MSLVALLQEIDSIDGGPLTDFLAARGFADLPRHGAAVLGVLALSGGLDGGLLRELELGEAAAGQLAGTLVQRGYLQRGSGQRGYPQRPGARPAQQRPAAVSLTRRGRAAAGAIKSGVEAARWVNFRFRPGDIVISGMAKSGMTWVQMICALLVFRTPQIPAALPRLSPWLDEISADRDQIYARLAGQDHRRFMKTHSSLGEVVRAPQATYLVVARHPLDRAISFYHQIANLGPVPSVPAAGGAARPGPPRPEPPREFLLRWIDTDLAGNMQRLAEDWAYRGEPNVEFVRYEDLCADLDGMMRQLAARLGISTAPEASWPDLVRAATFQRMRAAADRLEPVAGLKSNAAFFRRGTFGAGHELLTPAELASYHQRAARLAPADLLAWLHRPAAPSAAVTAR